MKNKEKRPPDNPYATNSGGIIKAPHTPSHDEPKGSRLTGKDDLRNKK